MKIDGVFLLDLKDIEGIEEICPDTRTLAIPFQNLPALDGDTLLRVGSKVRIQLEHWQRAENFENVTLRNVIFTISSELDYHGGWKLDCTVTQATNEVILLILEYVLDEIDGIPRETSTYNEKVRKIIRCGDPYIGRKVDQSTLMLGARYLIDFDQNKERESEVVEDDEDDTEVVEDVRLNS